MKNNIFIIPLCALLDLFIIFNQRKKTSSEDAKRKNEERKKIDLSWDKNIFLPHLIHLNLVEYPIP